MADDTTNEARGHGQTREPSPALKRLDRLAGTWELSGDVGGTVTYEWMEGGFFLIQRVDLGREGSGMEVIGHERTYEAEPSADIKSRFYSSTGDTLDYVYELEGDILTIWFGEKGSPAYYRGEFSGDGNILAGRLALPRGRRLRGDLDQGRVANT